MKRLRLTPLLLVAGLLALAGCKTLTGDPVVIRAEQSIAVANATMNAVVQIDHANRNFWRTNSPEFHAFAEWLRTDVIIPPLTVPRPRGVAMCQSALIVKKAYQTNKGTNTLGVLIGSLATLETATWEAQKWLTLTNR